MLAGVGWLRVGFFMRAVGMRLSWRVSELPLRCQLLR